MKLRYLKQSLSICFLLFLWKKNKKLSTKKKILRNTKKGGNFLNFSFLLFDIQICNYSFAKQLSEFEKGQILTYTDCGESLHNIA